MINIYPGIPEDAIKVVEVGKGWMMCVVLSMRGILQEHDSVTSNHAILVPHYLRHLSLSYRSKTYHCDYDRNSHTLHYKLLWCEAQASEKHYKYSYNFQLYVSFVKEYFL